jgi:threonine-phosphate decarboxylase
MKKRCSHGGNIKEMARLFRLKEDAIIDFSSNVSPVSLPAKVTQIIKNNVKNISRYPDPESLEFKLALEKHLKLNSENIIVGNGSAELIHQAVYIFKPKVALLVSPTFSEYESALFNAGTTIKYLRLREKDGFDVSVKEIIEKLHGINMMFLCNPNNPTGTIISRGDLISLLKACRPEKIMLVLDEAFIDLAEENSLIDLVSNNNLLILRSMTKFFGLAGLRLGYAVGNKKFIGKLENFRQPWTVNIFAQGVGAKLIQDKEFKKMSTDILLKEREFLYGQLLRIKGLKPYPSQANFILIKISTPLSSGSLQRQLLKQGILVRDCSNFRGLDDKFIRVAVRERKDNLRLISELRAIFGKEK